MLVTDGIRPAILSPADCRDTTIPAVARALQIPTTMKRRFVIVMLATALTGTAHASASIVNACEIGPTQTVESHDRGSPTIVKAGEGLIDSGPAHLTVFHVALDHSIKGPWDAQIAPISPATLIDFSDVLESDIAPYPTTALKRFAGWNPAEPVMRTLQPRGDNVYLEFATIAPNDGA